MMSQQEERKTLPFFGIGKIIPFIHKYRKALGIMLLCGLPKSVIFVYSVQTGNLLYHYTAPGSLTFTEIGFSEDGSRAVALLEDGRALVGELYDSLDEMIEKAGE